MDKLELSTPCLVDRIVHLTTAAAWNGDPVVTGLVAIVGKQTSSVAYLQAEIVELRRQLAWHSGNNDQPPSPGGWPASWAIRARPGSRRRRRRSMSA